MICWFIERNGYMSILRKNGEGLTHIICESNEMLKIYIMQGTIAAAIEVFTALLQCNIMIDEI